MPGSEKQSEKLKFRGFRKPTTTPVPDEVFDLLLPDLKGSELKVLLYICRRTFGFKKDSDDISLNQMTDGIVTKDGKVLDRGTGLSKDTVSKAVQSLEEKGAIVRTRRRSKRKGDRPTTYTLNFLTPVSENPTPRGDKIQHPLSKKSNTQQTDVQQTDIQQVVVKKLKKFEIEERKAQKLASDFSPEHIEQKIALLEWKLDPDTTTRGRPIEDPAGWLIRAIEGDYQPPKAFFKQQERAEDHEEFMEELKQRQREIREREQRRRDERLARLKDQYGTTQDELDLWENVLAQIETRVTKTTYKTLFPHTLLLSIEDGVATIGVLNPYTRDWLDHQLADTIKSALGSVLDRPVEDLAFEVLSPAEE